MGSSPSRVELAEHVATLERVAADDRTRDLIFWSRAVIDSIRSIGAAHVVADDRLRGLARRAAVLADDMRFDTLYNRRRRIFAIGYRLPDANGPGRFDDAFYDLLASEARLASFVAIAKGDVPQHHWFHLGRLVTQVDGRATLMSWGGTMFEYLMPLLLMRSFPGTLLAQSCRAVVKRQIEYGRENRVPWGISESAYAFKDRGGNYQYRAFGVPGLGFRRGLADELVIAPYATALAALVNPAAAVANTERLADAGLLGQFGFYESLDCHPLEPEAEGHGEPPCAAGDRARVLCSPPGNDAGRAGKRHLPRCLRQPLSCRSAHPGDGTVASGARAARGDPVGATTDGSGERRRVGADLCVTAIQVAGHDEPAHAIPVEWPVYDGGDAHRRRIQHLA